ncbi:hypothetical protein B0H13DRAFT_1859637 [Mycena leptocephala]|nr:hypothetical protein B0H13DRAFT_1859637 [Mycena leptocephala]
MPFAAWASVRFGSFQNFPNPEPQDGFGSYGFGSGSEDVRTRMNLYRPYFAAQKNAPEGIESSATVNTNSRVSKYDNIRLVASSAAPIGMLAKWVSDARAAERAELAEAERMEKAAKEGVPDQLQTTDKESTPRLPNRLPAWKPMPRLKKVTSSTK